MNNRRRLNGVVIGTKMNKTVVVEIATRYQHPLYRKIVTSHNRVKAHDEMECAVGDEVRIVESKPISKTVRWVVEEITKRNERAEGLPEA